MILLVVDGLRLAIWAGVGVLTLLAEFKNKKNLKAMYGITWFALMVNLLMRCLGV
jgi:hypothetical protein